MAGCRKAIKSQVTNDAAVSVVVGTSLWSDRAMASLTDDFSLISAAILASDSKRNIRALSSSASFKCRKQCTIQSITASTVYKDPLVRQKNKLSVISWIHLNIFPIGRWQMYWRNGDACHRRFLPIPFVSPSNKCQHHETRNSQWQTINKCRTTSCGTFAAFFFLFFLFLDKLLLTLVPDCTWPGFLAPAVVVVDFEAPDGGFRGCRSAAELSDE